MKIGQVGKVEVVGEVSNRLLKSASMVGIWGDREGMITTIWDFSGNGVMWHFSYQLISC